MSSGAGKASRHEDPFAAKALASLQAALQAHLRDTSPPCIRKHNPGQFPTVLTWKGKAQRRKVRRRRLTEGIKGSEVIKGSKGPWRGQHFGGGSGNGTQGLGFGSAAGSSEHFSRASSAAHRKAQ